MRSLRGLLALIVFAGVALVVAPSAPTGASTLPDGFQETVLFSGLTAPTAVRFAPDGRVFVAEKSGLIKVFDNTSDTTPTVFADLRSNVHDFWDRGLLGLALHPDLATNPYVYALYTYDAAIGGTAPTWGDSCPNPPGATSDGCVVSGRLSRLQIGAGNVMAGAEQVLIEDWCQQYPSHSIGALEFGADGALYVSGGDGASFTFTDYGQDGNPLNPCGDPPVPAGVLQTPPTAEGGALRSQDLRTTSDPTTLDGAILRVDPTTGAGLPDNPLAASPDANARRIIAYGLRNPFRITTRPGTSEIWAGDVGWSSWEEIDRVLDPTDTVVENFGWPCYEGPSRQPGYDSPDLAICEGLYAEAGAVTSPYFNYHHNESVVPGEVCPIGGSSIAGISFRFYQGGSYPPEYDGALFFADYSRDCIWVMFKGANGNPDTTARKTFVGGAANPVDLQIGPSGDLVYVDYDGGTIRRVHYGNLAPPPPSDPNPSANDAPTATIAAPTSTTTWKVGDMVSFSGSATDPEQGALPTSSLSWSLILHHCASASDASTCHAHQLQTFAGVASGSFTAPDHEYPSHLELKLTTTDSEGLSDTESVLLQPQTVSLTFASNPTGLQLVVGNFSGAAPFTRTVIVGSTNSISAPSPQSLNGVTYAFKSWSDGGAQSHNIVAPATSTTYKAMYKRVR